MTTRTIALFSSVGFALTLATPASAQGLREAAAAAAVQAAAQTPSTPQPVAPEPEKAKLPVTGGATVDFMSHYVWRGFLLTDSFSFQPTAWAKVGDVTVSSWSTWAEGQDGGPLMEHDLTVDYSKGFGNTTLSVGYINYLFPAIDEGSVTNEFYVGSAFATTLNPTVKAYFDVHEGKGTYLNFGVSQPVALGSNLTMTPGFAIGYNHKQWIDESAWNDANFSLKFAIPVNGHFTLGPAIYYSKGLNDAIPDQFYGGVSVVTSF